MRQPACQDCCPIAGPCDGVVGQFRVVDVIAASEPVGTTCAGPEPNLVYVDFGDPDAEEIAEWRGGQSDDDEN